MPAAVAAARLDVFDGERSLLGADHAAVWPLTDEAAERLWSGQVGDPAAVFSVRGLPRGHRLLRDLVAGPNWYTFANDPALPDEVAGFLRRAVPWPDGQVAFYAHAPGRSYRLPWASILRHWRLFVAQDESFVFGLGRSEFAVFADGGALWVGGGAQDAEPGAATSSETFRIGRGCAEVALKSLGNKVIAANRHWDCTPDVLRVKCQPYPSFALQAGWHF